MVADAPQALAHARYYEAEIPWDIRDEAGIYYDYGGIVK
jgi:hypothetical protein